MLVVVVVVDGCGYWRSSEDWMEVEGKARVGNCRNGRKDIEIIEKRWWC